MRRARRRPPIEFLCAEVRVPTAFIPLLGDYFYISGGIVGAVLVILLILWVMRRG